MGEKNIFRNIVRPPPTKMIKISMIARKKLNQTQTKYFNQTQGKNGNKREQ